MVTTSDILDAYMDCRRNKRNSPCALMYEADFESGLIALRDRINDRTYQPGESVCFIVKRPRFREVFAASFEDRIVHHYIGLRLEPLLESVFTDRSFNCRKGKGQLFGITRLHEDIRECSDNYTRDCWVARLDIRGFFMAIDRASLAERTGRFLSERYRGDDLEDLRFLCRAVIMHAPERNCIRHSPPEMWDHISPNKSLFTNGEGRGMAIGNLPSQMLANFQLNGLDWLLLKDLGFRYTGRYVDDFYIVDRDKSRILAAAPVIREYLRGIGQTLHPDKFYLQHYSKGIAFTGGVVKTDRIYVCNRTIHSFERAVERLNKAKSLGEIGDAVASINSYLGILRHANEYAARRRILGKIERRLFRYIYIRGHFDVVAVKRKYRRRAAVMRRIDHGAC
ncbi:MAG: hypothetical protein LUD50_03145 [Clostridia bacterium]|nr:hypothetical protein [Clostridia bacterium]